MLVTLCMIVRDEADELADCLASAKPAVDEIVIADTGSTDNSREIARAFGAVVVESPWREDFAEARNAALRRAHGNWVLALDADERLEGDADALRQWLRRTSAIAGQVTIRNLLPGDREERHAAVRLFRRLPGVQYERRLHEQVVGSLLAARPRGIISSAPISILHRGYMPQFVGGRHKRERNLQLARTEVAERPDDPFAAYALGVELMAQGDFAAAADELQRARELTRGVEAWQSRLYKLEASALLQAGREEDALRIALQALRHFARFTDLHYLAGVLLARAGRPRDAERHLRRAIALGPAATPPFDGTDPRLGRDEAWFMLGKLLGELGRAEEALSALKEAVRLLPGDLGHVRALVEQQLGLGADPAELWRDPPPQALEVAAALYRLARWSNALAAFAEAERARPNLPRHLHLLQALCHVHLGDGAKAWRELSRAAPLLPETRRDVVAQVQWALGLSDVQELPPEQAAAVAGLQRSLSMAREREPEPARVTPPTTDMRPIGRISSPIWQSGEKIPVSNVAGSHDGRRDRPASGRTRR